MTKRMLSLLLALVMTLSLCVPALAADEFEAETVTEVEEQAPEAPAEPEAPEAEEIAEEAVEAPEAAAVVAVEEESDDEPVLVALGVVTKEIHWELYKAVQEAEELKAKVNAGEVRMKTWTPTLDDAFLTNYKADPAKNDPFKGATGDFATVLETAEKYLNAINGAAVDFDVTTSTIQTEALTPLKLYLEDGTNELVDDLTVGTISGTNYLLDAQLETLIKKGNASWDADTDAEAAYTNLTITDINDELDVTSGNWTKVYHSDYLAKLQEAIDAYLAYKPDSEKTYVEYKALVSKILDALVMEDTSFKPAASDMSKLDAAIQKAEGAKAAYGDGSKYVVGNKKGDIYGATNADETSGWLHDARDLKQSPTLGTTEFKSTAKYWELNKLVDSINNALVEKPAASISYVSSSWDGSANTATVTVAIQKYADTTVTRGDGNTYGIAWQVTQKGETAAKWYNGSNDGTDSVVQANIKAVLNSDFNTGTADQWAEGSTIGTQYADKYIVTGNVTNVGASNPVFEAGDVVTLHFYEQIGAGVNTAWVEIGTPKSFTIGTADIVWPTIESAKLTFSASGHVTAFNSENGVLIGTDPWGTTSGNVWTAQATAANKVFKLDISGSLPSSTYTYRLAVKVGTEEVYTEGFNAAWWTGDSISLTPGADWGGAKLTAGTSAVIELQSTEAGGGAWTMRASAPLKIEALSGWDEVGTIKEVLKGVNKLVQSDYKVQNKNELKDKTVAEVFGVIENDCDLIEANITSTTMADSIVNRNVTGALLNDLHTVLNYLEKKDASISDYLIALAKAKAAVAADAPYADEGKGGYTYDSIGKLNDLLDTPYESGTFTATGSLQSVVDAATKKLNDAVNALATAAPGDAAVLKAAIETAEALKETDYTAETWKPFKDALDNAKAVLANTNATQEQINTALSELTTAQAALAKNATAAKKELDAAVEKAEALNAADYTAESMKAVTDAVAKAEALADTATAAEIEAAAKAIEDAIAKLEKAPSTPVQPEIPAAPASGTGWVHASDGTWYYYKDKALQTSKWIYGKGGLWYYVDADGAMLTGFHKIGNAYFMLQTGTEGGVQGKLLSGWITDSGVPGGQAYARTDRNSGHFGEITWTKAYGDFVNGHFTKGDPAA